MRLTQFLHRWLHLAAISVATLTQTIQAQTELVPAEPRATVTTQTAVSGDAISGGIEVSEEGSALLRGPVHEAFAEQFSSNAIPSIVIEKEPPQPIDEVPPDFRPDGDNIQWIPGYWGWDIESEDFVWVTGVWRAIPPDQQWIPGYWSEVDNGVRWVSGFWTGAQTEQLVYMPTPPESIEAGPSVAAPGDDHFWIPGSWQYNQNQSQNQYDWQAGYWSQGYDDWVWIPSRYIWTPSGCIYRDGYWDYAVQSRGTMFCPMAFPSGYNQQFRPRYVVETGPLWLANLFVLPGFNHYAFGNYYGYNGNRQIYPWVNYYQRSRGYDPLFSYYAYQNRNTDLIRQIARVERQIANNPQYRAQTTVAAQLRALDNLQGPQANWALRAIQLNSLATQSNLDFDTPFQFASVNAERRTQLTDAISPARELAIQRRELELASTREDRQRAIRADARADAQAENRNETRGENQREGLRENADQNPIAGAAISRNLKRLAIRAETGENGQRRLSQTDPKAANADNPDTNAAANADRPNVGRPNANSPNANSPDANSPGNQTDNPVRQPGAGNDKPDERAGAKPGNALNPDRPRTQNPANQNPANQNPKTPNAGGRENTRGDRPTPNNRDQNATRNLPGSNVPGSNIPGSNVPDSRSGNTPNLNPAARGPRTPSSNNPLDRIQQGLDDKPSTDDARALRDMMRRAPSAGGANNPGDNLPAERNPATAGNRPNTGLPPATNPGQNRNPIGNAPSIRPPSLPRLNPSPSRQNPGAGPAAKDNNPGPAARPPIGNNPGPAARPPIGNPPGPAAGRPAGNAGGKPAGNPAANPGRKSGGNNRSEGGRQKDK